MTPEMLQAGYEVIRTRAREIQLTDWAAVLPDVYAAMKAVDSTQSIDGVFSVLSGELMFLSKNISGGYSLYRTAPVTQGDADSVL